MIDMDAVRLGQRDNLDKGHSANLLGVEAWEYTCDRGSTDRSDGPGPGPASVGACALRVAVRSLAAVAPQWNHGSHWMRESGLADLLPSLPDKVWVGVSAGSMVMTPRIGESFVEWKSAPDDRTLGLVDFSIFPHLNAFPTNTPAAAASSTPIGIERPTPGPDPWTHTARFSQANPSRSRPRPGTR